MLAGANSRISDLVASRRARLVEREGDGAQVQPFAPDEELGYYDLAFGAWFLNYAQTKEELTAVFENISLNLKPGGVFVGVVPHPTDDIGQRAATYRAVPLSGLYPQNTYTEELASGNGWGLRVFRDDQGVDFMTCHMKKRVHGEAARRAGMRGKLE
ncbi:hypothetical protein QQS21_003669 [Conoideocrella luteorostrata]|uniref:Methyltransferase domain-containing protein n=1 Tax=Conoideocrella luteorostrata TaxID=1105319 RepID=A0AAJ0FW70_9HYPO|nr:hypothetical protein QQS21_003669 [Conoideocrella luteorostrata]